MYIVPVVLIIVLMVYAVYIDKTVKEEEIAV